MTAPACSDDEFIRLFTAHGATETARVLGIAATNVFKRRRMLEKKLGINFDSPMMAGRVPRIPGAGKQRLEWSIPNGIVIVGGDLHTWGGKESTAMRAFIAFIKKHEPRGVILNGDLFDGASVSRFPLDWEKRPGVKAELEAVNDFTHKVLLATDKRSPIAWTSGNHDQRFERTIAHRAPEYAGVFGVHLKDHFPERLTPAMSVLINGDTDPVIVKHRGPKGGAHATYNNVKAGGIHIITNHLHAAKVAPVNFYDRRTLWGVDTGCLADPWGPQFSYLEDGPRDWREGFAILTFRAGQLMQPELVLTWDETHVQYRGEIIGV